MRPNKNPYNDIKQRSLSRDTSPEHIYSLAGLDRPIESKCIGREIGWIDKNDHDPLSSQMASLPRMIAQG
ncbi:MAG: hypothetical protein FJY85_03890 [Deltaproteobacteria bacterium]|nr:hypothetical protein [Deltaproteobacteria bacterium]